MEPPKFEMRKRDRENAKVSCHGIVLSTVLGLVPSDGSDFVGTDREERPPHLESVSDKTGGGIVSEE